LGLLLALLPAVAGAEDHPRFFITSARETAWAQMKADYEARPSAPLTTGGRMYKLIKSNADSGARYADIGAWGTWMYHVTGDTTYATKAWTKISSGFLLRTETCANNGIWGDYSREYFIQHAWMYDWLYSGLTAEQRTKYLTKINSMAGCIGNRSLNFRIGHDSDQTTGDYMGIAMWYVATGSYNATAETIWNDPVRLIGGLDSTTADFTTYRNAIYKLTSESEGGEWLEGFGYNIGTVKLLVLGADALRTATGVDHFPEITAWQQDAAIQHMHLLTPNSGAGPIQPWVWGDTQNPRLWPAYYAYETALVLAGVTKGTPPGPFIQDWVLDREEASTIKSLDPFPRGFLVFDPYATRGDYTSTATTRYVPGVQMLNSRTGWGASDSWFGAHFPPVGIVDHPITYWGAFQLWKNGKWAITHPRCYGGPCVDSRGSNGLSFSGNPAWVYGPREYRSEVTTRSQTSIVNFDYAAGTMGGSIERNHRYAGSASFIMEHTRSLVWLRDWDVIIAYDRANSKAPSLPTQSVSASYVTWTKSRPRKELYVHTAVSPTQGANYTDWIYDGSSAHTRVTHLLPASSTKTIEDEKALWVAGYYSLGWMYASEKKFHVRIVPTDTNQWEPFLNVWDAYGTSSPSTVSLVEDATHHAQGAIITRGAQNVLTMFNATQGSDLPGPVPVAGGYYDWVKTEPTASTILSTVRLRSYGYEVIFAAGSNNTKAILFDLDPSTDWMYQVNGGTAVGLAVSAEGIGIVDIPATGTVTLTVTVK
jgi:hypothetical protein